MALRTDILVIVAFVWAGDAFADVRFDWGVKTQMLHLDTLRWKGGIVDDLS
jgi:hypothetical protein